MCFWNSKQSKPNRTRDGETQDEVGSYVESSCKETDSPHMFIECLLCAGTESTTWNKRAKIPALRAFISSRGDGTRSVDENKVPFELPGRAPRSLLGRAILTTRPHLGTAPRVARGAHLSSGKEPEAPLVSCAGESNCPSPEKLCSLVYFHF